MSKGFRMRRRLGEEGLCQDSELTTVMRQVTPVMRYEIPTTTTDLAPAISALEMSEVAQRLEVLSARGWGCDNVRPNRVRCFLLVFPLAPGNRSTRSGFGSGRG